MIFLSVDYGDVRTGVAVCDKNELLASPVGVITERRPEALAEKLAGLAEQYRAEQIVMGLPRNMDGSEGPRAEKSRAVAAELEERGWRVVLVDERRTTVEAHGILTETGRHGKGRKARVDAVAATLILETYLNGLKR